MKAAALPVMLAVISSSAWADSAAAGLVVIFDGTRAKAASPAHEYRSFELDGYTYKLVLPDGRKLSGLPGHVVARVDYQAKDRGTLLTYMEAVAKVYPNSAAKLAPRIAELKKLTPEELAESTPVAALPTAPVPARPRPSEATKVPAKPAAAPANAAPAPLSPEEREATLLATLRDPGAASVARAAAVMELAMSPKPEYQELFVSAAADADPGTRKWSLRGLGKLKTAESRGLLMAAYRSPGVTPADQSEIIKQLGGLAAASEQALSVPALEELTGLLAAADSPAAVKERVKSVLLDCALGGGEWVRPYLAKADGPGMEDVKAKIAAADAAREKAIQAAMAIRFTPEDVKALLTYANGQTVSARTQEGELKQVKLEGRLSKAREALEDAEEAIAEGKRPISMMGMVLHGNATEANVKMLRHETTELASGEPDRIARVALGRLAYLLAETGSRQSLANLLSDTANYDDRQVLVDRQGNEYVHDPTAFGDFILGATAGVMNDMNRPLIEEANGIVAMMRSLSPAAHKRLGLEESE